MEIEIVQYAQGDTAVSYDEGKKCYAEIKKCLNKNERIILNFKDVNYVITAFLNPIIGDLIMENDENIMNRIEIENANNDILNKIKIVKDGALLKRNDLDEE
ncbi:STAS-like domain-containing protein [Faecalibacillus intestinalis]|mgnify:CR=1 FL=1|uniref:STAS-like domain-containing protein n=1 Tax=Faecalibacillus intestinalis TaxID=1982626 RepID=UPI00295E77E4|nr:STAS-like domain-containing protein [uncultured Faecalibacillus sp.]